MGYRDEYQAGFDAGVSRSREIVEKAKEERNEANKIAGAECDHNRELRRYVSEMEARIKVLEQELLESKSRVPAFTVTITPEEAQSLKELLSVGEKDGRHGS